MFISLINMWNSSQPKIAKFLSVWAGCQIPAGHAMFALIVFTVKIRLNIGALWRWSQQQAGVHHLAWIWVNSGLGFSLLYQLTCTELWHLTVPPYTHTRVCMHARACKVETYHSPSTKRIPNRAQRQILIYISSIYCIRNDGSGWGVWGNV